MQRSIWDASIIAVKIGQTLGNSKRQAVFVAAMVCFAALDRSTIADDRGAARAVVTKYCMDCHSSDDESGFAIDVALLDDPGSTRSSSGLSADVLADLDLMRLLTSKSVMPPPDADAPSPAERKALVGWLESQLIRHGSIGGTTLRRLSAREYANTINAVLPLSGFKLPAGFPPDQTFEGFDNQGDTLVVSPAHLQAFADTATEVADLFFAPPREPVESVKIRIGPDDLSISYSSALPVDGAMRLASGGESIIRNATWPSTFEAPVAGIYRMTVDAFAFNPPEGHTPVLGVEVGKNRSARELAAEMRFETPEPGPLAFDVEMQAGETIYLRYANASFDYSDKKKYAEYLRKFFQREPKLVSAWVATGLPPRGGAGWQRLVDTMNKGGLSKPTEKQITAIVKEAASKNVNSGEMLVYRFFEQGPNLGIREVTIEGPIEQLPDPRDGIVSRNRSRIVGNIHLESANGQINRAGVRTLVTGLAERLFRRVVKPDEVDGFVEAAIDTASQTGSIDDGLHLAMRMLLMSPSFLYRDVATQPPVLSAVPSPGSNGPNVKADSGRLLDAYSLASRLSYFLTSGPPDAHLSRLAENGRILDSKVLRGQAVRLAGEKFAKDFTYQWLSLDSVDRLMPDTKLIKGFSSGHREGMKLEASTSFFHVLENDLPVSKLIRPDYVFANQDVAKDIYQFDRDVIMASFRGRRTKPTQLHKISVDPAKWRGGLLSMPAVMMATANGVDTQPVLRGVWMLEKILGDPSPPPPKAVPALTPETVGATTIRQRMLLHATEDSCATCHREIDPIGFVLENFDAVGRWRDKYPARKSSVDSKGFKVQATPVDATGMLPNGTRLSGINDLKRLLAESPEPIAACLCEKMLMYGTGRRLCFREKHEVEQLVQSHAKSGYKLQSMLLDLIDSPMFRYK